ncbi:MAG: bifunctional diaminohydroxyphosphoribosylaminopyrimidine deaminase/5-amino-6-(5-phosphoribosylamino)uracil reductase RibD [Tindallia sp. MSAO_Bac2]|nr:MAG: bifunctional diaminohydroxyphosphoribosylaminopyrimidine deaminase/5-amino-6-(5-phosphoribosylamino)uracil reductase RibD [Tindallia sp. MSAO_Bac2]
MKEALNIAEKGWGNTNPNPLVGAVIVKNGQMIAKGYHEKFGGPHAEVKALESAGREAKGSDMYVTLEPCSHYGKTPPCVDAIIAAGIKRVFIAVEDPNEKVAGRGAQKLRNAGIEVISGMLEEEAKKQNEIFMHYIVHKKPYIIAKAAMSLDGKIAATTGHSQWITGEQAREHAHWIRQRVSSILVGVNTVLKDDPLLTVRLDLDNIRQPLRIILDSRGRIPLNSSVVLTADKVKTIVATTNQMPEEKRVSLEISGVEVLRMPEKNMKVDINALIDFLGQNEVDSLMVEGGGDVMATFMQEFLINKLLWYIAPKIIGGSNAPGPVGGKGISHMKEALSVMDMESEKLGDDWLMTGYLKEVN